MGADELTFNRLADRYVNEYAKPRKKSWKDDEWVLKRAKAEFGPRIISTISRKELVISSRSQAEPSYRGFAHEQGFPLRAVPFLPAPIPTSTILRDGQRLAVA